MRVVVMLALLIAGCTASRGAELVMSGGVHRLRPHAARAQPNSPDHPPVLVLALDGVSRDLLYDMLRAGELPNLAELLGGDRLAHAYFDDSLLSILPSTTMP